MADAKDVARELGTELVNQAIELAFSNGWKPNPKLSTHEQGISIVRRGIPLLMEDLKKGGLI